jgi:(4-(4-[2-(gamma-L-glutamylamino)ethyl]phenoxymethyl)furan-2-yl)methanamine synthase
MKPLEDIVGWDIGGAHVKACRTHRGEVLDVVQWPCPLWQGQSHLDAVLRAAHERWPRLHAAAHAVTMTGEMVDLFAHREDGVQRIAAQLNGALAPAALHFFAGDAGWHGADRVPAHWRAIASANWLATAQHAALAEPSRSGVLIDIGSTTTDITAFAHGRVLTRARSDAERLASGELVYHGVVRTPLCALAPRIMWRGSLHNVMNEFFATTADVYRTTGELDAAHDQAAAADNAGKAPQATHQRLARMIGLDARDGSAAEWLDFARAWRDCQASEIASQLQRVLALHAMQCEPALNVMQRERALLHATQREPALRATPRDSSLVVVSAGCGDFLVQALSMSAELPRPLRYGDAVAHAASPGIAAWAQVCAPSVAVACLLDRELR